jgi:hypothetical protein
MLKERSITALLLNTLCAPPPSPSPFPCRNRRVMLFQSNQILGNRQVHMYTHHTYTHTHRHPPSSAVIKHGIQCSNNNNTLYYLQLLLLLSLLLISFLLKAASCWANGRYNPPSREALTARGFPPADSQ